MIRVKKTKKGKKETERKNERKKTRERESERTKISVSRTDRPTSDADNDHTCYSQSEQKSQTHQFEQASKCVGYLRFANYHATRKQRARIEGRDAFPEFGSTLQTLTTVYTKVYTKREKCKHTACK